MRDNEREQVEWVFGLTGGELADEPWVPDAPAQRPRYWYEGVPDYAGELEQKHGPGEYRTVVEQLFSGADDEMPGGWRRIASYSSSGETECPGRQDDDGSLVRPEQAQALYDGGPAVCPLCEAGIGEDHEYIYLGDGWAEIVYFRPAEPEPDE